MSEKEKLTHNSINWFPGHMAKARRQIQENLKVVDIVLELIDARAPLASKNPMFDTMSNKPRLLILTKKDLADEAVTKQWITYYKEKGYHVIATNLMNFNEYKRIIQTCKDILSDKMEKEAKRGLKPRPIRAMILGIPNVGKSTFINRLAKRKATITGNRPGVTKSQQIIKVAKDFELFDTPGVLWPKFDDLQTARNIALIGSIKQQILPLDELFIYAIEYLVTYYPHLLKERYSLTVDLESDWIEQVYEDIATVRKIKKVRGYTDYDRVMEVFFSDLYQGELGKITWERV